MHNSIGSKNAKCLDDQLSQASASISNEFRRFVGDVENLFKETTLLTGDDLMKATQKLTARIESAKEAAGEVSDDIVERARKTASQTNQYVHDHTWATIGAGVAASFIVGYLVSRRS
jgi:ElaB/YqjD/DUF883 family membrane-anchored ribosome-binding protein